MQTTQSPYEDARLRIEKDDLEDTVLVYVYREIQGVDEYLVYPNFWARPIGGDREPLATFPREIYDTFVETVQINDLKREPF